MTEVTMDVALREGESLTYKVGQIIAGIRLRKELAPGRAEVLRQMRTEKDHTRQGVYRITFGYELVEEDE